jgi:hypothetical protein
LGKLTDSRSVKPKLKEKKRERLKEKKREKPKGRLTD